MEWLYLSTAMGFGTSSPFRFLTCWTPAEYNELIIMRGVFFDFALQAMTIMFSVFSERNCIVASSARVNGARIASGRFFQFIVPVKCVWFSASVCTRGILE